MGSSPFGEEILYNPLYISDQEIIEANIKAANDTIDDYTEKVEGEYIVILKILNRSYISSYFGRA